MEENTPMLDTPFLNVGSPPGGGAGDSEGRQPSRSNSNTNGSPKRADANPSPHQTGAQSPLLIPEDDPPLLGHSKHCCEGRCIRAKDCHASIFVVIIVLGFDSIFTYLLTWLNPMQLWAVIVNAVLTIFVVAADLLAVLSDPGIQAKFTRDDPRVKPPPPKGMAEFITIKGVQVVTPYCTTCRRTRPPRTSHCHYCNNCVDRFDHHCGVIGACVGAGNIRYFFAFLVSIVFKASWITSLCIWFLATYWDSNSIVQMALAIVCVAIGVIIAFQIGSMMIHYIRLFSTGYTHREHVKRDRLYGKDVENPFDNGCLDNCYEAETVAEGATTLLRWRKPTENVPSSSFF